MRKPDVIVSWPRGSDYPLWRQFIEDERERFDRIIVAFTPTIGGDRMADISPWVRAHFDATFVDTNPTDAEDWRNVAVNAALDVSRSDLVWFTEQDFFIERPRTFWATIEVALAAYRATGINERQGTNRWHPACLFVDRETVDATSRYFGQDPVDHFYRFGTELPRVYDLEAEGGLRAGLDFEHLQGTSNNHYLVDTRTDAGVFRRDRFRDYLRDSLAVDVPLEPGWAEAARREVSGG